MSRARALALAALALLAALAPPAPATGEALDALEGLLPDYLLGNLEDLVKAVSAACDILPLELLSGREAARELARLRLVEVRRGGRRALPLPRAHLALQPRRSPLTLYIPGWWNTPTDEAAEALTSALLEHQPTVLVLDTRLAFCRGYLSAAARVSAVSRLLYSFIENLNATGFPPSSVHLIGFSLGAHVAGMTGKLVRKGLNAELGRITALDPAKPCFRRSEHRLRRSDARFVHVVHSSAGVLGLAEPLGHADVYVNGLGGAQPECRHRSVSFECDHNQAWRLFAASVTDRRAMLGRRCAGWRELAAGRCSGGDAPIGYGCSDHSRGMFLYKSS